MSQGDRETVLNQLQDGGQRGEHSSLLGRLLLARRWALAWTGKQPFQGNSTSAEPLWLVSASKTEKREI